MRRAGSSDAAPGLTRVVPIRQRTSAHGRRRLVCTEDGTAAAAPGARVPRISRMLALAHHWRGLIRSGVARDQTDLAHLLGVTRARVTQVMNLLHLAPDIQETLLLASSLHPKDGSLGERDVRSIASLVSWHAQRTALDRVRCRGGAASP